MNPRAARLLRGSLLGSLATLLAALSHSWAGGQIPGPLALTLGTVFAVAVSTILVGRRVSGRRTALWRVMLAVGIGQLAFHLVFSLLATGAAVSGASHHGVIAIAADPAAAIERGGAWMWVAHIAAGALTVLYVRHLEHVVWELVRRLVVRALTTLAVVRVSFDGAGAPIAVSREARPRGWMPWHAIDRRGPPSLASA